jgi:acyl-CoA thioesterase-2
VAPTLEELLRILELEYVEENLYLGYHPKDKTGRLYGGQIMAQALIAAGRTVVGRRLPHSLHGYFLRPGDASVPVLFTVDRIRDGRSFTTRRIVAVQHGKAIFNMDVSFQVPETGLSHQSAAPDKSPPATIPPGLEPNCFIAYSEEWDATKAALPLPPLQHSWFRSNGIVESDDELLHAALMTYESDDVLLSTARMPHRDKYRRENLQSASLDHAMWFHQCARVDDWHLYLCDSPRAAGARGYNRGEMYDTSGRLVASTMQESLMRIHTPV